MKRDLPFPALQSVLKTSLLPLPPLKTVAFLRELAYNRETSSRAGKAAPLSGPLPLSFGTNVGNIFYGAVTDSIAGEWRGKHAEERVTSIKHSV